MLLLGALRGGRPAGPLAVMTLVEAVAAVVCEPGVHTTDPVILSATLQVHCMTVTCCCMLLGVRHVGMLLSLLLSTG